VTVAQRSHRLVSAVQLSCRAYEDSDLLGNNASLDESAEPSPHLGRLSAAEVNTVMSGGAPAKTETVPRRDSGCRQHR